MPNKAPAKVAKKSAAPKAGKVASSGRGETVRLMTLDERLQDMREHGREVRKTQASALAFLKRAGIVDASGQLAEPFRN